MWNDLKILLQIINDLFDSNIKLTHVIVFLVIIFIVQMMVLCIIGQIIKMSIIN